MWFVESLKEDLAEKNRHHPASFSCQTVATISKTRVEIAGLFYVQASNRLDISMAWLCL